MFKGLKKKILGLLAKRKYATKAQKTVFEEDLHEELERKIKTLKKDNDQKDAFINQLVNDIIGLENNNNH